MHVCKSQKPAPGRAGRSSLQLSAAARCPAGVPRPLCQLLKAIILPSTLPVAKACLLMLSQSLQSLACLTLCDPMDCCPPGSPVSHHLLELTHTHVHRVSDVINHILCRPLLLPPSLFPSIRIFPSESALCNRWPKYWSFSFTSVLPMTILDRFPLGWTVWISLQGTWISLEGTLKSLLQHQSSKASILRRSAFFIVQLSHLCMTTGKTIASTRWTFVGKVMSLLFNMLSRFVIAFLPRSKRLNFMASVTIRSDFGAPLPKVCHCFHCFPIYLQ